MRPQKPYSAYNQQQQPDEQINYGGRINSSAQVQRLKKVILGLIVFIVILSGLFIYRQLHNVSLVKSGNFYQNQILGYELDEFWKLTAKQLEDQQADTDTKILDSSQHAISRQQLGRNSWTLLHMVTGAFPQEINDTLVKKFNAFLIMFGQMYPCKLCANHFMDELKEIRNYEDVPTLNQDQLQKLVQSGQQLVLYDQLVISLKSFNHPGNSLILQPYINNFQLSIKDQFQNYLHSDYAQLIVSLRTVGKLEKPLKSSNVSSQNPVLQGKTLFSQVQQSHQFKLHQKTIQNIDFSKPIWNQIDKLSIQEKHSLLNVPTFISTGKKVIFKENPLQDFWYSTDFWRSNLTFQAGILAIIVYLLVQQEANLSFLHSLPFFIFGFLKWTLIEYYFHRFLLHYDLETKSLIGHHLMHHAFPQIKGKIAVSIHQVPIYMVGFYMFYSLFLEKFDIIVLLLGILTGLTLYDMTHYYFHFGPQINIGWLNQLKRNHLKHHYRDPNKGFGVSNTLWDSLFKTLHTKSPQKDCK